MNCFIFLGAFQLVAVESFNRNGANSHSVPSQGYVDLAEEAQAAQEALREAVQLKDNLFNKYSKEFQNIPSSMLYVKMANELFESSAVQTLYNNEHR